MKNFKPLLTIAVVALSIFAFMPAQEAQAGKKNFSISLGHGGGHFNHGHGHGHGHIHQGGYVWIPGYYVGHGCHAHWVPGHYEYRPGYFPY